MLRTKVDAARCAVHNMRREMEAKYVNSTSAIAEVVIDSMARAERELGIVMNSLEVLGQSEHPEGIPDTV